MASRSYSGVYDPMAMLPKSRATSARSKLSGTSRSAFSRTTSPLRSPDTPSKRLPRNSASAENTLPSYTDNASMFQLAGPSERTQVSNSAIQQVQSPTPCISPSTSSLIIECEAGLAKIAVETMYRLFGHEFLVWLTPERQQKAGCQAVVEFATDTQVDRKVPTDGRQSRTEQYCDRSGAGSDASGTSMDTSCSMRKSAAVRTGSEPQKSGADETIAMHGQQGVESPVTEAAAPPLVQPMVAGSDSAAAVTKSASESGSGTGTASSDIQNEMESTAPDTSSAPLGYKVFGNGSGRMASEVSETKTDVVEVPVDIAAVNSKDESTDLCKAGMENTAAVVSQVTEPDCAGLTPSNTSTENASLASETVIPDKVIASYVSDTQTMPPPVSGAHGEAPAESDAGKTAAEILPVDEVDLTLPILSQPFLPVSSSTGPVVETSVAPLAAPVMEIEKPEMIHYQTKTQADNAPVAKPAVVQALNKLVVAGKVRSPSTSRDASPARPGRGEVAKDFKIPKAATERPSRNTAPVTDPAVVLQSSRSTKMMSLDPKGLNPRQAAVYEFMTKVKKMDPEYSMRILLSKKNNG